MAIFLLFISSSAYSIEKTGQINQHRQQVSSPIIDEENSLQQARLKLENASISYRKNDMAATRQNLKEAAEWLRKAGQISKTEKAREEARKLKIDIEEFEEKLKHRSAEHENSLARFWHRATSIIARETDHLIHSYVELSIAEKTLKHLLNAKMHLFTAEHDLFVSHEAEDAGEELDKVLDYLEKAVEVAKPSIQKRIRELSKDIQGLKSVISNGKEIWKNDSQMQAMDRALKELDVANQYATPNNKLRIKLIENDIRKLRHEVESANMKNDYESAMATLQSIIKGL